MISSEISEKDLSWIGMMCRIKSFPKLEEHTYTWIFRILVLDLELIKHNYKMVCFAPENVNPKEKTVRGLILEGKAFREITLPLPKVNYDYYFGAANNAEKQDFTYEDFEPWALSHGYKVYPEKSLRRLASDKYSTAKILAKCDPSMVPYTELFTKGQVQVDLFLQNNPTAFIKPRYGSAGNGIFVIKKEKSQYSVDYYIDGEKITHTFESTLQFLSTLRDEKYNDYIIQEAIPILRYQERVFDIRVTMFKDGAIWHHLDQVRLGASGKDVSNGSQGGEDFTTEVILHKLFPHEKVMAIMEKIRISSEKIATFINHHIDDKVTELALDILVDGNENIKIAEINIKPGLSGGFAMYDHFFDMSDEEKYLFENYAKKHGEYLAKSLLHRCRTI